MLAIALSAAGYALLLQLAIVPWHDVIVLPFVLWGGARLAARAPPGWRSPILALLGFGVLVAALLVVWRAGFAGRNAVFAGLYPFADAGGQYADALRVAHGADMNGAWARRPIPLVILAALLRVGLSLRAVMFLLALAWAASAALLSAEVWRSHGRTAATVVLVLSILFARRYVGFVQSEQVGGPLGFVALALLWRAASLERSGAAWWTTFLGGMSVLALALLARPGPLFVVPALALWAARRETSRVRMAKLVAASTAVVALGVGVQELLLRRLSPLGAGNSDLPGVAYGLLHGEGHLHLFERHPYMRSLSQPERWSALWTLVRGELAERPWLLPAALARSAASYVVTPQGFFGFVWNNPDDAVLEERAVVERAIATWGPLGPIRHWAAELGWISVIEAVVMAAAAIAFVGAVIVVLARSWRASTDPHATMLRHVLVGALVSLPLLPPWITEGAQIHAAIHGAWIAAVAVVLVGRPIERGLPPARAWSPAILVAAAIGAASLVVLSSPWPRADAATRCGADEAHIHHVIAGSRVTHDDLDEVERNLAVLRKRDRHVADAIDVLFQEESAIVSTYDACTDEAVYLVGDAIAIGALGPRAPLRTRRVGPPPIRRLE